MSVVNFEKRGSIAYVTINRPEAMNALSGQVQRELRDAWEQVESEAGIRVAILTGVGEKSFSAGADLKEYVQRGEQRRTNPPPAQLRSEPGPSPAVAFVSKPVIAAINGYCLAGGLELAMACDIRIASRNAQFGSPEVKWNILHSYGALRLPHAVPMAFAMEMLLTGEFVDADRALQMGLVSRVVPQDQLMSTCEAIAEKIVANGPLAVRITKQLAYASQRMGLDQARELASALGQLNSDSPDTLEGPRAFTEKRTPQFDNPSP